jgi:hypothetical protein
MEMSCESLRHLLFAINSFKQLIAIEMQRSVIIPFLFLSCLLSIINMWKLQAVTRNYLNVEKSVRVTLSRIMRFHSDITLCLFALRKIKKN